MPQLHLYGRRWHISSDSIPLAEIPLAMFTTGEPACQSSALDLYEGFVRSVMSQQNLRAQVWQLGYRGQASALC